LCDVRPPAGSSGAADGRDRRLDEGRWHRMRQELNCLPAGAVGREDTTNVRLLESLDRRLDDRLEDRAGQMTAPMKPLMRCSPVSRSALRSTFTAPAWEQPDTMTKP
jgi:hypothetical protein